MARGGGAERADGATVGFRPWSPPGGGATPDHAIRFDPVDAVGGVRLAFFRDPDGNVLELVSGVPNVAAYVAGWT